MNKKNFRLKVFEKASYCRHFEEQVVKNIKSKNINIPTYISAGQEFIPATIATICEMIKVRPLLFGQHRCHSIYLAFGGDKKKLVDELLGRKINSPSYTFYRFERTKTTFSEMEMPVT